MQRDSTLQMLIPTWERHHELTRLRGVGMAHAKSDKVNSPPLTEEPGHDHRALAPRCDIHQWKGLPQAQGKQLRQGVCRGTNLHPQLQRRLRLPPQICHTPPALEIVKQGLNTPSARHRSPLLPCHRAQQAVARRRAATVPFVPGLAFYCAIADEDWLAFQEQEGLQTLQIGAVHVERGRA